jgi:hypothetical protein
MERNYKDNYNIIKNPLFIMNIETISKDTSIKIKSVIIPIHDLKMSAKSRVKHGEKHGEL